MHRVVSDVNTPKILQPSEAPTKKRVVAHMDSRKGTSADGNIKDEERKPFCSLASLENERLRSSVFRHHLQSLQQNEHWSKVYCEGFILC